MTAPSCRAYGPPSAVRQCSAEVTHIVGVITAQVPEVGKSVPLPEQHIAWSYRCKEHAAGYAYLGDYGDGSATRVGDQVYAVAVLPLDAERRVEVPA